MGEMALQAIIGKVGMQTPRWQGEEDRIAMADKLITFIIQTP